MKKYKEMTLELKYSYLNKLIFKKTDIETLKSMGFNPNDLRELEEAARFSKMEYEFYKKPLKYTVPKEKKRKKSKK